jgi:D-3-phosphoglycerate dehydrogenase / 2-oxoglutarate reductase
MKVAILDDYMDTLRTLECFDKLDGHHVTVFTDHMQDTHALVERLRDYDVLVLIRERTQIRAPLLECLPHLAHQSAQRLPPHRRRRMHPTGHRRVLGHACWYPVVLDG